MDETGMNKLQQTLAAVGQDHLAAHLAGLSGDAQQQFTEQLLACDFQRVQQLATASEESAAESPQTRAARALPPDEVVRLPKTDAERASWKSAEQIGQQQLAAGKVGVILVAGGQGSRLGFGYPKGQYPIGPASGNSLYQILAEQCLARGRQAGVRIPLYIMTSAATHEPTVAFFDQHDHFGLAADDVKFFQQGTMPAVDAATSRVLLSGSGQLALSPDGHGGLLAALAQADLFADMRRRGIETLYYHQVDNPTAIVCDPAFIGFHHDRQAEMSVKVVSKRDAAERMGVVVQVDGVTQIIEYSDLPADVASQTAADGGLRLWGGSTAIHLFQREFLERLVTGDSGLPFHKALKKVPFLDDNGTVCEPAQPNAIKFERFIFDALPRAERVLVLEADRAREFNPVKNADGDDSPATAQAALERIAREWLAAAGYELPAGLQAELSPLFALTKDECCEKLQSLQAAKASLYLS